MSAKIAKRKQLRLRRKKRIRKNITGSAERPRLSVFRSARHVYAQVVNDANGRTVVSVSSFEKGQHKRANKEACEGLGKELGKRCRDNNIKQIVFDKNGNMYHGRIKAFADGVRAAGVEF
ncbi:MAG: 50S ribosomal protein L18 [Deltaproteobacteria bacterium]|nr:50S ribosomal protein L18 [Deltaproteobacteria bacterium]